MGSLSTPGTLKILVIGAENLDRIVNNGQQQPYYIIECGKQRSRSKPCLDSGTNPHWNTAHKFELFDETAAVAVIKDEMTKGIIAEGLIDLSRARLSGRDAATAQLRNLAGQPAGRLRFKLKFQSAASQAQAARLSPPLSGHTSDNGMHSMVDYGQGDHMRASGHLQHHYNDAGSLPYSRRASETNSAHIRLSEAGSYRSTGSTDGRRSGTPSQGLGYATATLERPDPTGSLRVSQSGAGRRHGGGEEPDVVLASVTSKVSLAKQAMQQLTAELAELTGPGQSPQNRGQHSSMSPSPTSSGLPSSAFAAPAAQHMAIGSVQSDSRPTSRQAGVALNVLGQPVQSPSPQPPLQQQNSAWNDYKSLYQQQRSQQYPQQQYSRTVGGSAADLESWGTAPPGHDMLMPVYQQQPYDRRQFRVSTGSMAPSGMMSPQFSPHGSMAAGMLGADGMPIAWPRLRGVFGNGVLSTEELVALYADSGAASEKKLISLLEDALAAAHAEKVATEQELANVKQAMAEMSKQHYLDAKRLKEMTAQVTGGTATITTARSMTPPRGFRQEGTPPASPHGGGVVFMVDTKPSRSGRQSRASDGGDLRDLSPMAKGLTVATGRDHPPAGSRSVSASAATPEAAAAHAELTKLRVEHSRLQSSSAALEQDVARLKTQLQHSHDLEREVKLLKEQVKQQQEEIHKKDSKLPGQAAAAAAGAAAGGAVAAAAAAAELEALRTEHGRVRAQAEELEDEVAQLREASQQLQESQQQLEDLQAEHASVKAAFATTQQQLEKLRQQQLDNRSNRSVTEWQDATEDFETSSSNGGSPMPAYKLQIQVHQLERQLVEQATKTQEEATRRDKLASELQTLQERLEVQAAAAKQAEENARAAEKKAAEQATIAAAARAEAAEARASTASSTGKEAQLAHDLTAAKDELDAALADKAELETALGLLDRNSKAQIEQLQTELVKAQEEAAALREGSSDLASLQAQLAAAQEEATGLRNNSEEVEYLQAQLRRTLRQVVELQRQVQLLQQERSSEATSANPDQEAALEAAIRAETDFLMQELVAAKLELAQVKEQQLITQRQLFKAQESMKQQQHNVTATAVSS